MPAEDVGDLWALLLNSCEVEIEVSGVDQDLIEISKALGPFAGDDIDGRFAAVIAGRDGGSVF